MIHVNDKWDLAWQPGMAITDVLRACGFSYPHVVVSLNNALVPPTEYATQPVADGDEVKVIHIIAGG